MSEKGTDTKRAVESVIGALISKQMLHMKQKQVTGKPAKIPPRPAVPAAPPKKSSGKKSQ